MWVSYTECSQPIAIAGAVMELFDVLRHPGTADKPFFLLLNKVCVAQGTSRWVNLGAVCLLPCLSCFSCCLLVALPRASTSVLSASVPFEAFAALRVLPLSSDAPGGMARPEVDAFLRLPDLLEAVGPRLHVQETSAVTGEGLSELLQCLLDAPVPE